VVSTLRAARTPGLDHPSGGPYTTPAPGPDTLGVVSEMATKFFLLSKKWDKIPGWKMGQKTGQKHGPILWLIFEVFF
jgi:hypothetical protein